MQKLENRWDFAGGSPKETERGGREAKEKKGNSPHAQGEQKGGRKVFPKKIGQEMTGRQVVTKRVPGPFHRQNAQ